MASKLNPNVLYVAEPGESLGSPQADAERTLIVSRLFRSFSKRQDGNVKLQLRPRSTLPAESGEAGEESSDSDGEQEDTSHKLIRKVSTSGQIRTKCSQWGTSFGNIVFNAGLVHFLSAFFSSSHIQISDVTASSPVGSVMAAYRPLVGVLLKDIDASAHLLARQCVGALVKEVLILINSDMTSSTPPEQRSEELDSTTSAPVVYSPAAET
ncbi:unnamed protein product [Pleuronectes platessa]|uniref:Uncharacterized protein n=1 Tax=Pleuronectes platessa TaxID=8262 RepID=A0A9N7TNI0_PLEPL|nr:unnamed protein product [Pleuronectes platessa]